MDADQREFAARFGIGIRHARRITLVARGNKFNAGLRKSVRNLEISGAEEGKAAPGAVVGQVASDHVGDNGIAPAHTRQRSDLSEKALFSNTIIHAHGPRGSGSRAAAHSAEKL